jgi:hypothetical protein
MNHLTNYNIFFSDAAPASRPRKLPGPRKLPEELRIPRPRQQEGFHLSLTQIRGRNLEETLGAMLRNTKNCL